MKTIINFLSIGLLGLSSLSYDVALGQSWSLTGNAGTNAGTNFIGTTDNIALRFRTNNSTRMSISSGGKVGIGILVPIFKLDVRAGSINTDSLYRINGTSVLSLDNSNRIQLGDATVKVGIGTSTPTTALQVAGTAKATEFVGGGAGITSINASNLTSGTIPDSRLSSNVTLLNNNNTFSGSNTFSQDIILNGIKIGKGSGSIYSNITLGEDALNSNTIGQNNTAIGWRVLNQNTIGENNTAMGTSSLNLNFSGNGNSSFGTFSLAFNTTGSSNTAIGIASMQSNTQGDFNTAIGDFALSANEVGKFNTAIGSEAMGSSLIGNSNVAVGVRALRGNTNASNIVAVGDSALLVNGSGATTSFHGSNNTAIGSKALQNNTQGYSNTASGTKSLFLNTTGKFNAAHGNGSLSGNTTGSYNSTLGHASMFSNKSGSNNSGVGNFILYYDTTSNNNTALGYSAGDFVVNGINNTFIGSSARATTQNLSNSISLGYLTSVDASNKVRIGNTTITSIGGQVGWTTFSDGRYKKNVEEDVPGLDFISKLRPVTYTTDISGLENHYPKPTLREGQELPPLGDISQQEKIRYSGFIAQEVEAAAKEIGYDFSGVDKPQREGNLYGIRYAEFVVPMVKAIQEQQKQIEELKAALAIKNNSGAIKLGVNDGNAEILLGQNIPNPADNSTIIPFSIPSNCKSASILITDHATGRAIKAVPLSCKDTHLMLDAGSLASGTYSYTLFVDGTSIDTKQMVIVK